MAAVATPPSLLFIWAWFQETVAGLKLRESQLVSGVFTPSEIEKHLLGLTHDELKDLFHLYLRELNEVASLTMIASAEAVLRLDFEQRVSKRRKDKISLEFRDIRRRRGMRIRLNEDILGAWAVAGGVAKSTIGDFRGLLNLRDWLAHGRYWAPKLGQQYDAQGVFSVSNRLLSKLPILPAG
jgi:hypothetical protein